MNTALITGANRGIGLEFSRQYAAAGWHVLACSRYPEKSDELNELAVRFPERVKIHALDVSDHVQIDRLGQVLADESIDLLINNAGIYPDSDKRGFGHTDYAEWLQAFRINAMAPLKMSETFAAQISRSGQNGQHCGQWRGGQLPLPFQQGCGKYGCEKSCG